jgi:VanZ family protein
LRNAIRFLLRPLSLTRVWLCLGIVMISVIAAGSLVPLHHLPTQLSTGDKLQHFVAYSAIALWFGMIVVPRRAWYTLAIGSLALGTGIEILQGFTPYRTFDWYDMSANLLGVMTGIFLAFSPVGNVLTWLDKRLAQPQIETQ